MLLNFIAIVEKNNFELSFNYASLKLIDKITVNSGRFCPLCEFVVTSVFSKELFRRRQVRVCLAHRAMWQLADVKLLANVFGMLRFVSEMNQSGFDIDKKQKV
jgi:hypothetical protein